MKKLGIAASSVALVVVVVWLGVAVADGAGSEARDRSIPAAEASAAEQEARVFWDNPFQRILFVRFAATKVVSGHGCPSTEVVAFSLFGIRADSVYVDCTGVSRSPQ